MAKMYISGIYTLTSPSGKCYIGSASHLTRRRNSHFHHLRRGTHYNNILQNAWNRYGELLNFGVILFCRREDLLFYEQLLIDKLCPEYNISKDATCGPGAKGDAHWNGRTHPDVAASIGLALRGKPKSEEARVAMGIAAKNRDRSNVYSSEHAAAISIGVARYWQKRREQGLSLTNRTEAGHKKHSEAMRAHYALKNQGRRSG